MIISHIIAMLGDQEPENTAPKGAYVFECQYCGMSFGSDVMRLAVHIGKEHDAHGRKHGGR